MAVAEFGAGFRERLHELRSAEWKARCVRVYVPKLHYDCINVHINMCTNKYVYTHKRTHTHISLSLSLSPYVYIYVYIYIRI